MFRKIFAFLGTKIGMSLLAALAIVICAFAIKNVDFLRDKSPEIAAIVAEKEATRQVFEKDSDEDGLKDWEEVLYGFNPNSPDTKGNGLGDLEEVKRIKNEQEEASVTKGAASSSPTATDRFSRELFTQYIQAKQSGQEITPELTQAIASEVLSKSYDTEIPAFDESVLKTVVTNDPYFIRSYGNTLGTIVSAPLPEGTSNELIILEQIMARESTSEKNKSDLIKLHARYSEIRDELIAMKVPAEAKDAHAQLTQGIELITNVVDGIEAIGTDPIGALTKIAQYEDAISLMSAASLRLGQYFSTNGVAFSTGEAGYIFMQ